MVFEEMLDISMCFCKTHLISFDASLGDFASEVGVQKLTEVIAAHPKTAIYALGGVNAETIKLLLDCRCCGVAAIDLITQLGAAKTN